MFDLYTDYYGRGTVPSIDDVGKYYVNSWKTFDRQADSDALQILNTWDLFNTKEEIINDIQKNADKLLIPVSFHENEIRLMTDIGVTDIGEIRQLSYRTYKSICKRLMKEYKEDIRNLRRNLKSIDEQLTEWETRYKEVEKALNAEYDDDEEEDGEDDDE